MTTIKTIWVGRSRTSAKRMERLAAKKYGDAIATSGPIIKNRRTVQGWAVSVPSRLMRKRRKKK